MTNKCAAAEIFTQYRQIGRYTTMKFVEVGKPQTNVRIPTIEQGPMQSTGARTLASHLRQIATYLDRQAILIDLESEEAFDLENYTTEREKLYQSLETISFIDSE